MSTINLPEINLTDKEKKLVFLLVIVIMMAITLKFGYLDVSAKSAEVAAQNTVLTDELVQLNNLVVREENIKKEIEYMIWQNSLVTTRYGRGLTPEKATMFLDELAKSTGMTIQQISFGEVLPLATPVAEGDGAAVPAEGDTGEVLTEVAPAESVAPKYAINTSGVIVNYSGSYVGLKEAIDIINRNPERMNIDTIGIGYDATTGLLTGSFTINLYEMIGTDNIYSPPVIDDIVILKAKPFGVN